MMYYALMHLPGFLDYYDQNLLPKDGTLEYLYPFFSEEESKRFFNVLLQDINWIQDEMEIYEKVHPLPRLVAWYGEDAIWLPVLIEIKKRLEEHTKLEFNTVLLNLYRNERDHVSWHSDKYSHPDDVNNIVSISFGETRKFQVKHKIDKKLAPISIELMPGSLVIMKDMQQKWLHRIALTTKPKGERINLTFRYIKS
jgi:alkylated DNA repair dioxygenase AlkB